MTASGPAAPRPPRQKRSEETLRRILDAAAALLAERDLDEVSVEDLARRAGVSVGSVYTRFKSKDDLLAYLLDAAQRTQVEQLAAAFADERWRDVALAGRIDWLIERLQQSARARPGLIRAVFARLMSQSREVNAPAAALNAQAVDLVAGWFLAAPDGVTAPDPELAAATTASWLSYSVHLALLYDFAVAGRDRGQVVQELRRAALAALRPGG